MKTIQRNIQAEQMQQHTAANKKWDVFLLKYPSCTYKCFQEIMQRSTQAET